MNWEAFLKENGIRITNGRILILKIIESSTKGLTAEQIYEMCKDKNGNLNLSTIYRSVELFEEKGIVKKINIDGVAIYLLRKEDHKHMHILKCDKCDKSVEIRCPMEEVEEAIKVQVGFSLTEHKLELKGICDQCKKSG